MLNERLEDAGQASTSQAFNLAISAGIIPAVLVVVLVFIILKGSLVGALFTAMVAVLGLVAFANLTAYIARGRTTQRFYDEQIVPKILEILEFEKLTRFEFDHFTRQILAEQALLRTFLDLQDPDQDAVPAHDLPLVKDDNE